MEKARREVPPETAVELTIEAEDLEHFRLMLREQIAGDAELVCDLHRRSDLIGVFAVEERLNFLWRLAAQARLFAIDTAPALVSLAALT